jgi:ferric-dicitrate binding protein FerR (iron transport regulator)
LLLLRLTDKSKEKLEANQYIEEALLLRYIRGVAATDEIAEVEQWMDAAAENRKIVEQLCVLDYGNEALCCIRNADPQTSLAKVKRKIRNRRLHRVVVWTQRAAAVLFVPFFCLTLHFMRQPTPQATLQPQEINIVSAPGVITSTTLPDGTKVWLNANSRISYPSFFAGERREISLSGEAYLEVSKNKEKPFFIRVNDAFKVKVTGTELNIEAYPDADHFSTTLVEGEVHLVSAANPDHTLLTLRPGEQSVCSAEGAINVRNVHTSLFTSWKDGKIMFKNASMDEIAVILEKRYNARFVISPRLKDHRFTGTFTHHQLVQILEHFRISSNIRYEIKGHNLNPDGTIGSTLVELN